MIRCTNVAAEIIAKDMAVLENREKTIVKSFKIDGAKTRRHIKDSNKDNIRRGDLRQGRNALAKEVARNFYRETHSHAAIRKTKLAYSPRNTNTFGSVLNNNDLKCNGNESTEFYNPGSFSSVIDNNYIFLINT